MALVYQKVCICGNSGKGHGNEHMHVPTQTYIYNEETYNTSTWIRMPPNLHIYHLLHETYINTHTWMHACMHHVCMYACTRACMYRERERERERERRRRSGKFLSIIKPTWKGLQFPHFIGVLTLHNFVKHFWRNTVDGSEIRLTSWYGGSLIIPSKTTGFIHPFGD